MYAQSPQDGEPYEFTGVVQLDSSIQAEALFNQGRRWFTEYFRDGKSVLQVQDKQSGEISGKGNFPYKMEFIPGLNYADGHIEFIVTIHVKNGKYKYTITDFKHYFDDFKSAYNDFGLVTSARSSPPQSRYGMGGGMADKQWGRMKDAVQEKGKVIEQSLIDYMAKAAQTQDW
jgi:hypothetical protein